MSESSRESPLELRAHVPERGNSRSSAEFQILEVGQICSRPAEQLDDLALIEATEQLSMVASRIEMINFNLDQPQLVVAHFDQDTYREGQSTLQYF